MSRKQKVMDYLETEPQFRERKNKDRGIVNLLIREHRGLAEAIEKRLLTKDLVVEIVQQYAVMDRSWRQILEQHKELRGSDYADKAELEKQAQRSLGYNV